MTSEVAQRRQANKFKLWCFLANTLYRNLCSPPDFLCYRDYFKLEQCRGTVSGDYAVRCVAIWVSCASCSKLSKAGAAGAGGLGTSVASWAR